eukprot:PhF_6_TR31738/c0_g1_i1/m.46719
MGCCESATIHKEEWSPQKPRSPLIVFDSTYLLPPWDVQLVLHFQTSAKTDNDIDLMITDDNTGNVRFSFHQNCLRDQCGKQICNITREELIITPNNTSNNRSDNDTSQARSTLYRILSSDQDEKITVVTNARETVTTITESGDTIEYVSQQSCGALVLSKNKRSLATFTTGRKKSIAPLLPPACHPDQKSSNEFFCANSSWCRCSLHRSPCYCTQVAA